MEVIKPKTVDEWLNEVDYSFVGYVPSKEAAKFINFMKLVNGPDGEENESPVVHFKLLDNVFSGERRLAILCHRGFAKALALDEVVYTDEGTVDIGSLEVGARIYGEDGKLTTVLAKSEVFNKPMYRLTLEDGRTLDVSEDHINTVIHRRQKRVNGKRTWFEERRDLTTKELLDIPLNHKRPKTPKNPLGRENRVWLPLCSPVEFTEKHQTIDPYTLGLLLGDGSMDKATGYSRLHAHQDDMDFYVTQIPHTLGKRSHKEGTNCDYVGVRQLGACILELGLGINGDHKFIPENYLYGSVKQRLALLQGLMDTDGTIGKVGGASFTSNSFLLARGVMSLVRSLGGIATLGTSGDAFRVGVNLNLPLFRLPRKLDRQTFKSKNKVAVESITRIADEPSQCISVDNESKTFLTTDYIVTHNSTILSEYLPLYCAVFGHLENFGDVNYILFIGDSMENGCRNVRRNMENRYNQSEFLQKYLPKARFTDSIIEFTNIEGKRFAMRLAGAQQSIRGSRYLGVRPQLAIMDDILTDEDARSKTCIEKVKDTIGKGIANALHPELNKVIYVGTVFNANDPLYTAIESGRWSPSVYPICEKFPCTKEEFRGSWEDRFGYKYVKDMYDDAMSLGRPGDFFGELMNRVTSEENRLIPDGCIQWYSRQQLLANKSAYNFYITTDFATSEKTSADFSVISVWAYNAQGLWFLVDGVCRRQIMSENVENLFRLAQEYNVQGVGVEVTGQQGGFISWIRSEMLRRNQFFPLTSENNNNSPGIRPVVDKLKRFYTVEPWFKQGIMFFPEEFKGKHELMNEMWDELTLATRDGFKSKHDDALDTISMLSVMNAWKPTQESKVVQDKSGIWGEEVDEEWEDSGLDSYLV